MPRSSTFVIAFVAMFVATGDAHALRQAPNACVAVVSAADAAGADVAAPVLAAIGEATTDLSNCVGTVLRTNARYQRARVRIATNAGGAVRAVRVLEGGRAFHTCARRLRRVNVGPDAAGATFVLTLRVGLRLRGLVCEPTPPSPEYEATLVAASGARDRVVVAAVRRLRPYLGRVADDVGRCLRDGQVVLETGETPLVITVVSADPGARAFSVRSDVPLDTDLEFCIDTALTNRVPSRVWSEPAELSLRLSLRRLAPPS